MCGIVGVVGTEEAPSRILDGLRRLEYRGYDSAGLATIHQRRIERRRAQGKVEVLAELLGREPVKGRVGIGHTRWATHGAPCEANAHPHASARCAVVHNGIIENFDVLRRELIAQGCIFHSETDTEVVVHLITRSLDQGETPEDAVRHAIGRLQGASALGVIFSDSCDRIVAASTGCPLIIGIGRGETLVASDALALAPWVRRVCHLRDGDCASITAHGIAIRNVAGKPVSRAVKPLTSTIVSADCDGHRHFMVKEIWEQPKTLAATLHGIGRIPFLPPSTQMVRIVACGTSHYAGMVGKYWLERLVRLPVDAEVAGEFRYRRPVLRAADMAILLSQSGETADSLAALRHCRSQGQPALSIVNVPDSAIARESDAVLHTAAGPEISVASTKAFTAQLAVLAGIAVGWARQRGLIDEAAQGVLLTSLGRIPDLVAEVLRLEPAIATMASRIADARSVLVVGRGTAFPIALEGALKLKETSYIHAEGLSASELKHGPIALVDEALPVVALCPSGELFGKTLSNLQEIHARRGALHVFSDRDGMGSLGVPTASAVALPDGGLLGNPILYAVAVQLLAYHVALLRGCEIDKPRNLAKSVTVE